MGFLRTGLAASLLLLLPARPAAADSPTRHVDCSAGPIADKPLSGTVNGAPFLPKQATVHITKDGMEVGSAKFDRYVLSLITDGIFNEATVDMLVPLGKKADGRTFRVLPIDSISAQPAAAEGTPEVQGWSIELEAAHVDTSFTETTASIRVEWGVRKGDAIPGRIHICVPSVKADIQGSFTATFE
ncbi:MAG: hypothetical protein WDM91_14160 [Rhizomicrobium sp.]